MNPSIELGSEVDLRNLPCLRSLCISIPYALNAVPNFPEIFTSVVRSWRPPQADGPKTLTLTPTFQCQFYRNEFADVLRALGRAAESILLGSGDSGGAELDHECDLTSVGLEVCVVDPPEKQDWWRDTARESFPTLHALGRLRVTFWKGESTRLTLSPSRLDSGENDC